MLLGGMDAGVLADPREREGGARLVVVALEC